MADSFEITDAMRSAIGSESPQWPVEFTTTGIRGFARGVGYTDPVYFDVEVAKAAGYASLPAPPTYGGIPVFIPGKCDNTYGFPLGGNVRIEHGLKNLLDGGTEYNYVRVPVAGETLMQSSKVADLEVKTTKSLGTMLLVTSEGTFVDSTGAVVMTTRGQAIYY
jgi:N-terminal half of MaoC dehydratase